MTIGKGYFLVMLNNYLIERIKGAPLLAVGRFLFSVGSGAETLGMFERTFIGCVPFCARAFLLFDWRNAEKPHPFRSEGIAKNALGIAY